MASSTPDTIDYAGHGHIVLTLGRDKNLLIVISGDATIRNFQVLAEATINFGPKGESTTLPTKPQSIKLVGTIKSKEPLKPFIFIYKFISTWPFSKFFDIVSVDKHCIFILVCHFFHVFK